MIEKKESSIKIAPEKTVLVGISTGREGKDKVTEYLDELEFLVDTAGGVVETRFIQNLDFPNPKTYVGTGKLEEIVQYVKAAEIDMVVFDADLKFTITQSRLHMNVDYTPYEGMEITGMPEIVYSRGKRVAQWNGEQMEFVGQAGHGRFIKREPVDEN